MKLLVVLLVALLKALLCPYAGSLPLIIAAKKLLKYSLDTRCFSRTRAFNLLQLFDFVTVQLSKHYARRACDVANGRQRAAPVRGGTSQETGTVTQVFCMTRELIEVT